MDKLRNPYSHRPSCPYDPGENIPDRTEIPEKTLSVLTEADQYDSLARRLIEPLGGKKQRPWFSQHAYFCLPITFGNQHGFIVRALYDFFVRWNGGDQQHDVVVHLFGSTLEHSLQIIEPHFGIGTFTVQNRWTFRTPRGTNLLVGPPPNFPLPGVTPMTAVVESDQLRRDFTFNFRITVPDRDFYIPRGTPLGWVLPYPRHFLDSYRVELHPKGDVLEGERRTAWHFGESRRHFEEGVPNHRYMRGVDIYGNKFPEHQKTIQTSGFNSSPEAEQSPSDSGSESDTLSFDSELLLDTPGFPPLNLNIAPIRSEPTLEVPESLKRIYPTLTPAEFSEIVRYVASRREEGFDDGLICSLLTQGGWEIDAARIILSFSSNSAES